MPTEHAQDNVKLDSPWPLQNVRFDILQAEPRSTFYQGGLGVCLGSILSCLSFPRKSRSTCLCDADAQDANAAASSLQPLVDPKPAQPTPVQMDAAHKQLKSYLPGELCEAFRAAGMTHDLYDWQVCVIIPLKAASTLLSWLWVSLVVICFLSHASTGKEVPSTCPDRHNGCPLHPIDGSCL